MTLVPVDPRDIPMLSMRHAHCKAMRTIEEFMRSEHEAVQLQYDTREYSNAASVQSTYKNAIRKLHVDCVVLTRQGKVYLIKGGVFN